MKDLENRVLSSNTWGLLAILHEGLIERIDTAIKCIEDAKGKEDLNPIFDNIRDILSELSISFKEDTDLGQSLKEIYLFATKLLSDGFRTRNLKEFKEAKNIIIPIHQAFVELSQKEDPDIISGLTYSKDSLINTEKSRFDMKK